MGYTVNREERRVCRGTLKRLRGRLKATVRESGADVDAERVAVDTRATVKGLVF